jgi:hypothetical protein
MLRKIINKIKSRKLLKEAEQIEHHLREYGHYCTQESNNEYRIKIIELRKQANNLINK